jgi:hypothetical protein
VLVGDVRKTGVFGGGVAEIGGKEVRGHTAMTELELEEIVVVLYIGKGTARDRSVAAVEEKQQTGTTRQENTPAAAAAAEAAHSDLQPHAAQTAADNAPETQVG